MDIRDIVKSRKMRNVFRYSLSFLPDSLYLRLYYFSMTGKVLHLKKPTGFNEKLQWLKLHDKHPEYTKLVDKLAVKKHIISLIGKEYIFPLLGYWKSFDEIDFDLLPDKFILKCNHDSGSIKIIDNKNNLTDKDKAELSEYFEDRLKRNYFYAGREYPCKRIHPYIIAEKFMGEDSKHSINDYKFFCFNGVPKIMFVATDRSTDCKFDFFDMDFNHLDIENIHPNANKPIPKPEKFEEMKKIAAKLSKGIKFVRIDLYELNGQIYFGEYTFFHGGGFQLFHPDEWERRLGDWIEI